MAAIKLRLLTDGPHEVEDLGITINGTTGDLFDLVNQEAQDVSMSVDLQSLVASDDIVAVDPRDPSETTNLSKADSATALRNHNQIHWGVIGGRFGALDDPNTAVNDGDIVTINGSGVATTSTLTDILSGTDGTEAIQDVVGDMFSTEGDVTYDDTTGKLDIEDVFLRNTGDNLESGTLTVDSGASIDIASGASLTIQDTPTAAKDAVNKEYVDGLANGLDYKESVQVATTPTGGDLGFTYDGGTKTLSAGAAGATVIDGVTLSDGDRVLVKDQIDPTQNGIYVVSDSAAGSTTVLTRAPDQDGDGTAGEVSAGNTTFVEAGTENAASGWIVTGAPGTRTVDTDPIVWTQNSGQNTYSATNGIDLTGSTFTLDIETTSAATVEAADEIAFNDVTDGTTKKTTISDLLSELNVVSGVAGTGVVVQTAPDTYSTVTFAVDGPGNLDGLAVANADATGNPTFGLDIQNLPAQTAIDITDRIPVWDADLDTNVFYTVGEVAGALAATDSFKFWTVDGVAGIEADDSTDTVDLASTTGITITADAGNDRISFNVSNKGLVDTAVESTDTVLFFDGSNTDAPASRSFADILADLDVVNGISANGFVVRTADDTYVSRSIVESTTAGEEGLVVTNGDGVAGNPTVALDINGLTDSADAMAATDEFVVFDGTNNVSMSGAQVTEGVTSQLGGLELSTVSAVGGATQPVLTINDTTRSKRLSVDTVRFEWSENSLGNNDWIRVGAAVDAQSGVVMPMDATIVMVTAHCENASGNTKNIVAYINTPGTAGGTPTGTTIATLTGADNAVASDATLSIDVAAGDRLRLRAEDPGSSGNIQDTVVNVFVKWRV